MFTTGSVVTADGVGRSREGGCLRLGEDGPERSAQGWSGALQSSVRRSGAEAQHFALIFSFIPI